MIQVIRRSGLGLMALLGVLIAPQARATTIYYEATNVSGSTWEYGYTVDNDTLTMPIEELTLFFDANLYSDLVVTGSPAGWDTLVADTDLSIPADGFFDSLALAGGIAPQGSLGGFLVQFKFPGGGVPGPQAFDIVDPDTWAVIDTGFTQLAGAQSIPEPGTLMLMVFGIGLLALGSARGRSSGGRQGGNRPGLSAGRSLPAIFHAGSITRFVTDPAVRPGHAGFQLPSLR